MEDAARPTTENLRSRCYAVLVGPPSDAGLVAGILVERRELLALDEVRQAIARSTFIAACNSTKTLEDRIQS